MSITPKNTPVVVSLSAVAVLLAAGCQNIQPEKNPFEPRKLQQSERTAPAGTPPTSMPALPSPTQSPLDSARRQPPPLGPLALSSEESSGGTKVVVPISLEEVVDRAILNNLDVKVAGYDPAIEQTRVVEAESRFDPEFFANAEAQDQKNISLAVPINSQFSNSNQFLRSQQAGVGVRQNLESGGQAELRFGTQQLDRDSASASVINPYWLNDLTLKVTQPLLREFGLDVNQARIRIARNQKQVSQLEFRKKLEENLETIERAYWQLALARRELDVTRQLLERTEETGRQIAGRAVVEEPALIPQISSSAAIRRSLVIRAESRVAELSDQIKQLMNDPEFPISGDVLLVPETEPLERPVVLSLEDQVQTALDYRPELGQQQIRIDSAAEAKQVAENNILPQLNLVAAGSLQVAGDSFAGAFEDNGGSDSDFYDNWSLGVQFAVPIGNRSARAVLRRANLQRQQAIDSYRSLVEQISLEVKSGLREVETSWNEVIHAREAKFLAADALSLIEARKDADQRSNSVFIQLILDRQASLAQAESTEANAIAGYNQAITRLERAKGTLLKYNNVEIVEEMVAQNP